MQTDALCVFRDISWLVLVSGVSSLCFGSVIKIISHLPEAGMFVFNMLGIQNLLQSEVSRI